MGGVFLVYGYIYVLQLDNYHLGKPNNYLIEVM